MTTAAAAAVIRGLAVAGAGHARTLAQSGHATPARSKTSRSVRTGLQGDLTPGTLSAAARGHGLKHKGIPGLRVLDTDRRWRARLVLFYESGASAGTAGACAPWTNRGTCGEPRDGTCGVPEVRMPCDLRRGQWQPYGIMITRVPSPALSHLRPALRLARPARPVISFEGCGAAGAATRGRCAAPHSSAATAGLGRPDGPRRADPAAAATAAAAPAGYSRHRPALAPPPGHPMPLLDLLK